MNDLTGRLLEQFAETRAVEWVGLVTGVAGVAVSIREHVLAWPLFIACYGSYVYIAAEAGFYAQVMMNLVFIALSCYGWYKWVRGSGNASGDLRIGRTPARLWPRVAAVLVGGTLAAGYLLGRFTDNPLPYPDAFATVAGFVAQWMLGRKYIETWIFWIVADLVFVTIWATLGHAPSVVLFSAFIVLAVIGMRRWRGALATAPR